MPLRVTNGFRIQLYLIIVLLTLSCQLSFTTPVAEAPEASSITCFVSTSTITLGSSITVSGDISPSHHAVNVTLIYTDPDAINITRTVITSMAGSYADIYTPPKVGSWKVVATWEGDIDHSGAASPAASFTVELGTSSISCSVSIQTIKLGDTIKVSGSIFPIHVGAIVTLTYKRPIVGTIVARAAISKSDGAFSDSYAPDCVGVWSVSVSWLGDYDHRGATSLATSFSVGIGLSSISCSVSSQKIKLGEAIMVSGALSPPHGAVSVTLIYKKPDESMITRTVTSTSAGIFTDYCTPDSAGTWNVSASWPGDLDHSGVTSSPASFTVESIFPWELVIVGVISTLAVGSAALFLLKKRKSTYRVS